MYMQMYIWLYHILHVACRQNFNWSYVMISKKNIYKLQKVQLK